MYESPRLFNDNMKPENKIYKEGEVYNNLKCCYNTKFMQNKSTKGAEIRKKREKYRAKMEVQRDGTINTHPFSHPWMNGN